MAMRRLQDSMTTPDSPNRATGTAGAAVVVSQHVVSHLVSLSNCVLYHW